MSHSPKAVNDRSLTSEIRSLPGSANRRDRARLPNSNFESARARGVSTAARLAVRELKRLARPTGDFDASRYFRGDHQLGFYNVGTQPMRMIARAIHVDYRDRWTVDDAMRLGDMLIENRYLEAKSVRIEVVARYRRAFTPALLPRWKRWLAL